MADGEDLASVLAFLDALEGDEEQPQHEEQTEKQQEKAKASSGSSNGELARKRRRAEAKYTTNLQRKKRAELGELREQAAVLETRLKQLQQATRPSEGGSRRERGFGKKWAAMEEKAAAELMARRRAEADNKKLRSGLERLTRLREDIGRLVDKLKRQESAEEDEMDLVAAGSKLSASSAIESYSRAVIVPNAEMTTRLPTGCVLGRTTIPNVLEQLISQIDNVLSSSWSRSHSSWLEVNEVGHATEIRMSTKTECSAIAAADLLWRRPDEKHLCSVVTGNEVYIHDGSHSFKRFFLPRQCRPWNKQDGERHSSVEVVLNVEHYSRRVYDAFAGRVILVTLALVRLPDEEEVLVREHFWKCITPIKNTKGSGSLVQTSYRVERGDGRDVKPNPAQASVIRSLVQLTRRNHAMYQDWLLEA